MIVAFLDEHEVGTVLEPPKNPHITVKKKFKLINISEDQLVCLLGHVLDLKKSLELELGSITKFDSEDNKVIEVLNSKDWIALHKNTIKLLGSKVESRDPHFEGENYYPHLTWKLKGEVNLEPERFVNRKFNLNYLYLIQRVDPVISRAKIIARFSI